MGKKVKGSRRARGNEMQSPDGGSGCNRKTTGGLSEQEGRRKR